MNASALVLFVLAVLLAVVVIDGRVIGDQDATFYYKMLGRMHNAGRDPIIASRVPKMDRNCFFSPVQCMLSGSGNVDPIF